MGWLFLNSTETRFSLPENVALAVKAAEKHGISFKEHLPHLDEDALHQRVESAVRLGFHLYGVSRAPTERIPW